MELPISDIGHCLRTIVPKSNPLYPEILFSNPKKKKRDPVLRSINPCSPSNQQKSFNPHRCTFNELLMGIGPKKTYPVYPEILFSNPKRDPVLRSINPCSPSNQQKAFNPHRCTFNALLMGIGIPTGLEITKENV
ncbi:hypothetical protein CEXT_412721 [Caerostris extrusa]|uniref:Uncharacterized protein n=1 Tax=Caerostris extrusa TaxID=172846 RepID=A0AAV4XWR2_CAEEX|nr:hypothetical protein CEXT_412721 [Caerostris extrusa]